MKYFTKEVRIALVAIVGLVVLYFGMNFLKGMSLLANDNTYYVKFKDISGLSASNPIFADGYQVGVVKDIVYDYETNGDVVVKFDVNNTMRIPKGSSAEIVSDLMGNVKMNLLLANNPRERVEPGDTIIGAINGGAMGKLAANLRENASQTRLHSVKSQRHTCRPCHQAVVSQCADHNIQPHRYNP